MPAWSTANRFSKLSFKSRININLTFLKINYKKMTSSNKIQNGLTLIIGPIVAFLCYLIGGPFTWSGYNYIYGNISTDRFSTLIITLILIPFFGWSFLYLVTKLLKVKIVLWQAFYYWIIVALTLIILLTMYGISRIS